MGATGVLQRRGFIALIAAGMLLGTLIGVVWPGVGSSLQWLGDLFLKALKLLVVPLIVASMISGITALGDIRKLGRAGARTVAYYVLTTFVAVALGMLLVNLVRPGHRGAVEAPAAAAEQAQSVRSLTPWEAMRTMIESLIPDNVVKAAAEGDILPLIVVSLLFGAALSMTGERGRPLIEVIQGLNQVVMMLVHWVVALAPLGILALVAGRFGRMTLEAGGAAGLWSELARLGWYMGTVLAGLAVHALVVLPLLLLLLGSRNPARYAAGVGPALLTAFSTASSSATLPLTMECLEERNQVSPRAVSLVTPLGATINMDGTALYEAVAVTFIAQTYGLGLSPVQQLTLFLTATLAAIGAAGIPEAGLVTMVMVMQAVGLPVEGIALILVVDWLLDRFRTAVNVWGDSVGAAIIARWEFPDDLPTRAVKYARPAP